MKFKIYFVLFIYILLSLPSTGAILEYKFKIGDIDKYKEVNKITFTSNIMGEDIVVKSSETLDVTETLVEEKNGIAKIKLNTKYKEIIVDNEAVDVSKLPVDNFFFKVNKQGKIISVLDSKEEPIKTFDPQKDTPMFIEKDLKVGDSWDGRWTVKGLDAKAKMLLVDLYSKNGVDVAKIKIDINDKIDVKEYAKDFPSISDIDGFMKINGTGYYYFAVNLGKDILIEYTATVETIIKENDREELFSKSEVQHKYYRVD